MKAGTRDSSQPPTNAEEEALKRNTDCVYFLASPLTCKKGSECEYRHSEDARINPRDCRFWLNRNCLNAKCTFRHPPLDGLLGNTVTTPAAVRSTLPPSQTSASIQFSSAQAPSYNSSKQATPCFYYFQKGFCLKGDRCPFMHGSQPIDNQVPQPPAPKVFTSVTETQTHKKALGGLEKCTQQKKILQANIINPVEVSLRAKPPTKSETLPSKYRIEVEKTMPLPISLDNELPMYKPTIVPPFISENSVSRTHRVRQSQPLEDRNFRNAKEPDEFLGESSPGFDVLVDDELLDSNYYQNEDDFRRMTGHEGRLLNVVNEFDYGLPADYNSMGKYDRETYNDPLGYDQYGGVQDQYAWEQRRASSERISERPSVPERRGLPRPEGPDQINELDLRYRLSKQRRIDGSRLTVSPDRRGDSYRRDDLGRHVENQRYRSHSRRDSHHLLPRESSISNRLRGRISLLGRSSPDSDHNDSHMEREMDRGRSRSRPSPGRPLTSSYQGRTHDRIKRRIQEDYTAEGRNFRGPSIRRDDVDNILDFEGPKSLAELKGSKVSESGEDQRAKGEQVPTFGEWKNPMIGKPLGHQESDGSLSFEGPKPLSVILKRKRGEKQTDFGDGIVSGNGEESNEKGRTESLTIGIAEKQTDMPSEFKKEANRQAVSGKEEARSTIVNTAGTFEEDVVEDDDEEEEEGLISTKEDKVTREYHSSVQRESEHEEAEEDVMMIDKGEDQELETYDHRDEESDYEAADDGGEFKTGEDENADPGEEYFDDEDGDDFAKRIGVMFS